jgi:hypothetical protein
MNIKNIVSKPIYAKSVEWTSEKATEMAEIISEAFSFLMIRIDNDPGINKDFLSLLDLRTGRQDQLFRGQTLVVSNFFVEVVPQGVSTRWIETKPQDVTVIEATLVG